MNVEDYLRQAETCEAEARKHTGTAMRQQFELLARQWRDFAEKTERIARSRQEIQAGLRREGQA